MSAASAWPLTVYRREQSVSLNFWHRRRFTLDSKQKSSHNREMMSWYNRDGGQLKSRGHSEKAICWQTIKRKKKSRSVYVCVLVTHTQTHTRKQWSPQLMSHSTVWAYKTQMTLCWIFSLYYYHFPFISLAQESLSKSVYSRYRHLDQHHAVEMIIFCFQQLFKHPHVV